MGEGQNLAPRRGSAGAPHAHRRERRRGINTIFDGNRYIRYRARPYDIVPRPYSFLIQRTSVANPYRGTAPGRNRTAYPP